MKKLQVLIPIMLAFSFLAACGTITVDSLHPVVRSADLGKEKTIVILPFADYTPTDTPAAYWRRNMLIMEALQDEIIRFGYAPAVSEDVIAYLSRRNIIRPDARFEEESTANAVLRAELGKDWSDSMKIEIAKALQSNLTMARQTVATNKNEPPKSIALDHSEIQKIGSAFNAHYVVRGRIMVFENGREDSFNPLQTGVLPFFFNFSSRTLFGIAESEKYEMIDKMAIGGLLGAALALDDWPKNDETITTMSEGHPRFEGGFITETVADTNFNRAVWGGCRCRPRISGPPGRAGGQCHGPAPDDCPGHHNRRDCLDQPGRSQNHDPERFQQKRSGCSHGLGNPAGVPTAFRQFCRHGRGSKNCPHV